MIPLRPGLVLALALAAPACHTTYELPEQVERRPAVGLESLTVRQAVGSIRVLAAQVEDVEVRAHPRVRARSRAEAERRLAHNELLLVREGEELMVQWSEPPELLHGFAADLDITLPASLAMTIDSGVGEVEVRGLTSALQVALSVGDVSIEGDRSPSVEATVDVGDITVDADPTWIQLTADIGNVEAEVGSELQHARMTTQIGDVVLGVPDGMAPATVSARSDLGDLVIPSRLAAFGGDDPGSPRVRLESSIGDVIVRRSSRSARRNRFD